MSFQTLFSRWDPTVVNSECHIKGPEYVPQPGHRNERETTCLWIRYSINTRVEKLRVEDFFGVNAKFWQLRTTRRKLTENVYNALTRGVQRRRWFLEPDIERSFDNSETLDKTKTDPECSRPLLCHSHQVTLFSLSSNKFGWSILMRHDRSDDLDWSKVVRPQMDDDDVTAARWKQSEAKHQIL